MVPPDARANSSYDPDLETLKRLLTKEPERLSARFERLFDLSEGSEAYLEEFAGFIQQGLIPVVYANHLSLADKFAASLVTKDVTSRVPQDVRDFRTVVAASLEGGQQGEYVSGIISYFESVYAERGYGRDIPFVTENDRQQREVEGSNLASVRTFLKAANEKSGIVIFPEGTMEGGRMGPDGVPLGLQRVDDKGLLFTAPKTWARRGKGTVFLPVGIVGSNDVFPPDHGKNRLSSEVMSMLTGNQVARQLVTVSVGKPFVYSGTETPDFMMQKVATLLPQAQRGHYS